MARFHQSLVILRRGLLLLGWGVLIAEVTLAIGVKFQEIQNAPVTLSSRLSSEFGLNSSARQYEDDAVAEGRDVDLTDSRGRPRFAPDQAVIRFHSNVAAWRCEVVIATQRGRLLACLDSVRNIYLVSVPEPTSPLTFCNGLRVLAEIEYAAPNLYYYPD